MGVYPKLYLKSQPRSQLPNEWISKNTHGYDTAFRYPLTMALMVWGFYKKIFAKQEILPNEDHSSLGWPQRSDQECTCERIAEKTQPKGRLLL